MMQRIIRVGLVLLIVCALGLLADWLWGRAASSAVIVIAGMVFGMFYVPRWGVGQATEQDRVRERLVQNMKVSSAEEKDGFGPQG